ncbi:hypothetical protein [Pelomonas sp. KK5]|uniref:hypothetical protein n=1 Tax=Pelomonas sp. KK5 TaxID=1855730 RepID=UPI00117F6012|nr:hypothetical protein [Pelomonas sp. KK5]
MIWLLDASANGKRKPPQQFEFVMPKLKTPLSSSARDNGIPAPGPQDLPPSAKPRRQLRDLVFAGAGSPLVAAANHGYFAAARRRILKAADPK